MNHPSKKAALILLFFFFLALPLCIDLVQNISTQSVEAAAIDFVPKQRWINSVCLSS